MQQINTLTTKYSLPTKGVPPHELSAMTEEIRKEIGFKGHYGRGYWLKRLKAKGTTFGELLALLKKVGDMDGKYNKGGWLTNQLKVFKE